MTASRPICDCGAKLPLVAADDRRAIGNRRKCRECSTQWWIAADGTATRHAPRTVAALTAEQQQWILDWRSWARTFARQIWRRNMHWISLSDADSVADEAIVQAAVTYDPTKQTGKTPVQLIYLQVRRILFQEIARVRWGSRHGFSRTVYKHPQQSLDAMPQHKIDAVSGTTGLRDEPAGSRYWWYAAADLSPKQIEAIEHTVVRHRTCKTLALQRGITLEAIRSQKNSALRRLRYYLENGEALAKAGQPAHKKNRREGQRKCG